MSERKINTGRTTLLLDLSQPPLNTYVYRFENNPLTLYQICLKKVNNQMPYLINESIPENIKDDIRLIPTELPHKYLIEQIMEENEYNVENTNTSIVLKNIDIRDYEKTKKNLNKFNDQAKKYKKYQKRYKNKKILLNSRNANKFSR